MFQNNLMAGAAGQGGFYDYQIDQSLRFNDNDSAYLSRTPASASNRRTWTWSGWVKRGNLGFRTALFEVRVNGTNFCSLVLDENDRGRIYSIISAIDYGFTSNDVFRDTSSWYHFVWVMDTTNATSSDRSRLYVNNRRIASFGDAAANYGEFPLNYEPLINTTSGHNIGLYVDSGNYFDGYMAEVNFIDGQALDPTDFGQFKSDIWIPKKYTGSYGTNGFYLTFEDSAAIGDDLSGNTNDWTPNNLDSTDVMLDSPTNNFAVLNPLNLDGVTLSNGNLASSHTSTYDGVVGTIAVSSGKWYWETSPTSGSYPLTGIIAASRSGTNYLSFLVPDAFLYEGFGGGLSTNNSTTAYGATYGTGDIIGIALDMDAGELTFYKNGVSQGVAKTGLVGSYVPLLSSGFLAVAHVANFGQSPFAYTPPADFLPLNTANLPEPTITPALDDVPADYFNTVLYTGDAVSPRSITGVGFQPDWTWIKARSVAYDALMTDVVRGAARSLTPSSTAAEILNNGNGYLSAFDADGFTLTQGASSMVSVNQSGQTYVAWNWKAAGAGVANTDGTISSTVSANQKAGFSIVSYTGTGSAATIGHGLGVAPAMVIVKNRDNGAVSWVVYHKGVDATNPENYMLFLNLTNARSSSSATGWNSTAPTSSVFSVNNYNNNNQSGSGMVAYCFAEVEGYSKFGSYTGNGSTDGPFVYCGFRPAFVIVKRSDNTGSWYVHDKLRAAEYNPQEEVLLAEASNAAQFFGDKDFVSNGFKIRDTASGHNTSGGTYIFAAFAEAPFKYSNAR